MKLLIVVGVTVANELLVCDHLEESYEKHTRAAVQVRNVEDISRAALGSAGAAKASLSLDDGGRGSEGRGGESEDDGGVLHVDRCGW